MNDKSFYLKKEPKKDSVYYTWKIFLTKQMFPIYFGDVGYDQTCIQF